MGSAGIDDSSQKTIEPELLDVGNKLLATPSSTDELLILLDKAESLLAKVWQQPPRSTRRVLLQTMKALITDELLRNDDLNVQIAVASCCNELTRITAPELPYEDDTMRVIFQLFMIAFEQLSCESGRNYYRALHIVETIAKVRSSLILLDVDTDGLVPEMFQLFLKNIRSNHPSDVFKHMETIMTLVIEESDEVFELLRPLLTSVKMKNKDTSPISWELGKKVFKNCATRLNCYLKEAVKEMNLEIDDYAEVVAGICRDTSDENNMVAKEVSPTAPGGASRTDGLSKAGHENCSPKTIGDKGALRKRRRKPSSTLRPEEYENSLKTGDRYSHEGTPGYNAEKEDLALTSELGSSSMLRNSSRKKIDSFSEVGLPKNGQSKKKKSTINQYKDLDLSSTLKRKILKLRERGYDAPKKKGKRAIAGSSKMRVEKERGVVGDTSKERKHQLSPQELSGRKESISHKYVHKDAAQKMEEFSMSKSAKANLEKEKKKAKRLSIDYGEELINLRIQVWWPMDEVFYAGTVEAFDPETKKHTILYDDNEIEILDLTKEKWKQFGDKQPPHKLEADHSSPSRELIKTKEKNTNRKASLLKKQHSASSSKRSKCENRSLSKSEGNSSPVFHRVIAESDEETCETNVSAKVDGEKHVGKEESEVSIKKTESDQIQ